MSTSHKKYDVFISFRGEDTRSTFTTQLHETLTKENIESYIDENLTRGEEVGPALVKAIQESHISIVVFSQNYATSKWCLDELLEILKCRKLHGQVVIPVFYKIDPSHVRHQKESYEKAFAKYEKEKRIKDESSSSYEDKVSQWKAALTKIANISGWHSSSYSEIKILEEKALVTISNSNRIQMHDLLQNMAFDIARNHKGPERFSRLRDSNQVSDVLKSKKDTRAVEGIIFDLSEKVDLHIQANTFKEMTKLWFLRLYVPLGKKRFTTLYPLDQGILSISDKLRYLEWSEYPFKSLPHPFCATQLVEIHLPHSNIEHIWDGNQELANLETINLSECKKLIKLPDLSGALKLKCLYLSGCQSLCAIESRTFSKDTLVTVLLDRCKKLQSLKSEKHLRYLEKINVNGCFQLKEFSVSSDSIQSLDLRNTGVEILHSSIGRMGKLVWLNLEGLPLKNLPKQLSGLRSLTELCLSKCNAVTKSKLEAIFDGLKSLTRLYLKDCRYLIEIPANISSLSSLYELRLDGSNVKIFPEDINYVLRLEIMSLDNCKKLQLLPELPPHIKEFYAENCTSLVKTSTLKTFSKRMNGKEIYISFKNCNSLDEPSLRNNLEAAIITMKSAAFHNISLRQYGLKTHYSNYNSVEFCLPGRRVPTQFKYQTKYSCIKIELPKLSHSLGFIFSVVVSPPSYGINTDATIQCQCYSEDGRKLGYASKWHHINTTNLKSDHVFVWYDPYHSDNILGSDETNVSFEFSVTDDTSGTSYSFMTMTMKECGICPVYLSEIHMLLTSLNFDKEDIEFNLCHEEVSSFIESSDTCGGESSSDTCGGESSTGEDTQIENQEFPLMQHDSLRIGIYNEMESSDITSIDIYDEKENFCTRIQNEESNMNEKHESFGRCDEEENINESLEIQNQELDYEKCHCSCDCLIKICHCSCDYCLIGPLRYLWRLLCICT